MNILLEDYLKKQGVEIDQLDSEERATFDSWRAILDGKEMTVEKILLFIESQLGTIDRLLANLDNKALKNERLLMQRVVYKVLESMIKSPNKEREALQAKLTSLLHS